MKTAIYVIATTLLCLAAHATAAAQYSNWQTSTPDLDTANSVQGGCPIESRDGLTIFTASGREGGQGSNDIWIAQRPTITTPFGLAENLPPPINSPDADFCPTPLNSNNLMFVSTRPGGCGSHGDGTGDIYFIRHSLATGWGMPEHLGCSPDGPNTTGAEFSPSLLETEKGTFLFFSSNGPTGNQDIYMSTMRADGSFAPGVAVNALNTEYDDRMPTISSDGLEIVFSSNRPTWNKGKQNAAGGQDVYTAKRRSLHSSWSDPVNLSVTADFPTKAASETRASFSWDGLRLHYGSAGEIYVSERNRRGRSQ